MSRKTKKPITTQQYARIIKGWMRKLEVEDVSRYSTHSMRKTKASVLFQEFKNVEAVRKLLGHRSVSATSAYLGVEGADATELAISADI
jgi:site-specific recombinase XerD